MVGRSHLRCGFTLLEMLVALGLMAIVATALYASLHTGLHARMRAEAAIAPVRCATVASELVRGDVVSALPPTGILAGAFVGQDEMAEGSAKDADKLEFYSCAADVARDEAGVRKLEFALEPAQADEEGSDYLLVRRVTANLLAPITPAPETEVLCRHVISFNLRYFDGSAWLDSWDSSVRENALPLALEAAITIRESEPAQAEAESYQLVRVFLLPCGTAPSDGSTARASSFMIE